MVPDEPRKVSFSQAGTYGKMQKLEGCAFLPPWHFSFIKYLYRNCFYYFCKKKASLDKHMHLLASEFQKAVCGDAPVSLTQHHYRKRADPLVSCLSLYTTQY